MARPYLQNADQLLAVEWGKVTAWDCKFQGAPAPFNDWFPATVIERRVASLTTEEVAGPVISTSVPGGEEPRTLQISFNDDELQTAQTWFSDWMAEITNDGLALTTVKEACRTFFLAKLDNQNNQISLETLYVFPFGELRETWSSTGNEHRGLIVQLAVAGRQGGARARTADDTANATGTQIVAPGVN